MIHVVVVEDPLDDPGDHEDGGRGPERAPRMLAVEVERLIDDAADRQAALRRSRGCGGLHRHTTYYATQSEAK